MIDPDELVQLSRSVDQSLVSATKEHCGFCWKVLEKHFQDQQDPPKATFQGFKCPLFITWQKRDTYLNAFYDKEFYLRGCIGTFEHKSIRQALKDYTNISAFRDRRFGPIEEKEMSQLQCSVSFLKSFEVAKDIFDWEVGKHGIIIQFKNPDNYDQFQSATFLPEVCPSQNWNKDECIRALIDKSGYDGDQDQKFLASIKLIRYQSSKEQMTYDEYYEWQKSKPEMQKDSVQQKQQKKYNIKQTINKEDGFQRVVGNKTQNKIQGQVKDTREDKQNNAVPKDRKAQKRSYKDVLHQSQQNTKYKEESQDKLCKNTQFKKEQKDKLCQSNDSKREQKNKPESLVNQQQQNNNMPLLQNNQQMYRGRDLNRKKLLQSSSYNQHIAINQVQYKENGKPHPQRKKAKYRDYDKYATDKKLRNVYYKSRKIIKDQ